MRVISYLQSSCFNIQGIFNVKFVETSPCIQQNLPNVIDIPSPFMKPPLDIQFMSFGIHDWMEDWMLKYKSGTISILIIVRNENLETENSFLVNALTNENN